MESFGGIGGIETQTRSGAVLKTAGSRTGECALLIFLSAFTVCQPFCRIAVEAGAKDQHGLLLLTLKSSPSVPSKSVQTMESKPTGLKDISNFNGNSQTQGKRERFFGKTIF